MAGENENVSNENVNPEIQMLQVIVTFLNRVELKGNEESALLVELQDWNGKRMHLGTLCATHEKTRS